MHQHNAIVRHTWSCYHPKMAFCQTAGNYMWLIASRAAQQHASHTNKHVMQCTSQISNKQPMLDQHAEPATMLTGTSPDTISLSWHKEAVHLLYPIHTMYMNCLARNQNTVSATSHPTLPRPFPHPYQQ
eukprot:GHRR01011945.1.p1 GENE.GHRR01011945.1~~GHRR01011945.1.p1  ORF type:complete len:129 (+),score=13.45 GHRR01011945.1:1755-2141(+)